MGRTEDQMMEYWHEPEIFLEKKPTKGKNKTEKNIPSFVRVEPNIKYLRNKNIVAWTIHKAVNSSKAGFSQLNYLERNESY